MDVWMPALVQLERADYSNDVHETSIKLEVVVTRTNVIGAGQDALHYETDAHCVEEAKVLWDTVLIHDLGILLPHVGVAVGPLLDNDYEHDAEKDVANIAEDVVEGCEGSWFDHAKEVEVAAVLVATLGQLGLVEEDELEDGQCVKGGYGYDEARVVHHLAVD